MCITSLVIPVPAENMDAYRTWAQMSAAFFKEYGCLEIVEIHPRRQTDGLVPRYASMITLRAFVSAARPKVS